MKEMKEKNSIEIEDGKILERADFPDQQVIFRIQVKKIATRVQAGQFVQVECAPQLTLRRPISIMRANKNAGWIELAFKVVGKGTTELAKYQVGDKINLLGPIGKPFTTDLSHTKPLLIGGGIGMPPMVALADSLREIKGAYQPMIILGSESPFPFKPQPSKFLTPFFPDQVTGAMPLLEEWGFVSRLTSLVERPGHWQGYVTDLARMWLESLSEEQLKEVIIYSCGPHPMLEAVAKLADKFSIPCQVSLEEFMACGVGGCAGCVVEVDTANGKAMQRVCVDGPIFDAKQVFTA